MPGGRRARVAAVVVVLAAGVALTVWRAPDLGELADAFADVRWPLASAALAANLASVTCRALVWRLTLRQALHGPMPPLRHVLAAHWIGVLGNVLFPARAGEATRVAILARHVKRDGAWAQLAGAALAHRLVEAVPVALLILGALALAPVPGWARTLLVALALVIAAALVLAVVVARRRGDGGPEGDEGVLLRLRRGLGLVREPVPTALALLAGAAAIGLQLVGLWLVLLAFDLDVGLTAAVVVLVLAELVVLFPLWPGNVGVYQGVLAAGLLPFGVPYTTGLAYGLVTQGLDAAAAATVGAAGLAVEGGGLRDVRGEGEERVESGGG